MGREGLLLCVHACRVWRKLGVWIEGDVVIAGLFGAGPRVAIYFGTKACWLAASASAT